MHTEAENIPPMHAKNRSTKVTLLGCFQDGFPNRKGEGRCNTIGWRVYDAANQKMTKKQRLCGEQLNSSVIACYKSSMSFGGPV